MLELTQEEQTVVERANSTPASTPRLIINSHRPLFVLFLFAGFLAVNVAAVYDILLEIPLFPTPLKGLFYLCLNLYVVGALVGQYQSARYELHSASAIRKLQTQLAEESRSSSPGRSGP